MINIKSQLPGIYYEASRDFQILGHLYEVVLNYTKTNADMMYLLPNGVEEDTRATELLATTLGFKLRRNYDKAQLAALVSIFPQILKLKGTTQSIKLVGDALVKASGIAGTFGVEFPQEDIIDPVTSNIARKSTHELIIKIPAELSDITLFVDLLPYILPAGLRTSIVRNTIITQNATLPLGTDSVIKMALPGTTEKPYPLGLSNISETNDGLTIKYASTFIDSEGKATVGLLGTSPIANFTSEDNSVAVLNKEET